MDKELQSSVAKQTRRQHPWSVNLLNPGTIQGKRQHFGKREKMLARLLLLLRKCRQKRL